MVLAMVLLLSTAVVAFGSFGAGATGLGTNETLYFNLSKNSSWYTNGSGDLYARFYKGSTLVGNVKCTMESTNIYKATSPAVAADTVQLAVYNSTTEKDLVLNDAKTNRVYLLNTKNWSKPYLYNWKDGSKNDGAWPGKDPGMTALSGKMYYYEITKGSSYKYVIFSNNGDDQTDDLEVFDDMKYWDGANSKWVKIFSSSTSKLSLSSKASDANEIYLEGTNLRLSKYQYSGHDNFAEKTFYVYNPNWTSTAYVQYDLSDPYQGYVQMTKVAKKPAGFYKVTLKIAPDAAIKFSATNSGVGASLQTTFPDDTNLNCYKMGSGAETWVNIENAQKAVDDLFADKMTTGDNNGDAFWVDAVYYDYKSDKERATQNGWLNPDRVGTYYNDTQHTVDKDDWYPFKQFNSYISRETDGVNYPLYFGNFCNTPGAYPYNYLEGKPFGLRSGGYGREIMNLNNFNYIANNSNGLKSYDYAVKNLAANKLTDDGQIQFPNGTKMPYFQKKTVTDNYARSVQSYFPFRSSTIGTGTNQVTTYSFNSNNARDNVFFKWSNGKPSTVNYGQGTNYGVKDGLGDFEYSASAYGSSDHKDHSGYGIFPFNNKNNGNDNPGNGKLDYGFGIRMDMNFRVPAGGVLPNGNPVEFKFTGDDDLWVYISPVGDDGQPIYSQSKLALDLGGSHKMASGSINFKGTPTTTVSKTTDINSDSATKYRSDMMVFHDEGGWGSNMRLYAWKDRGGSGWFVPTSIGNNNYAFRASQKDDGNSVKLGDMEYFFITNGKNWTGAIRNTFKHDSNNDGYSDAFNEYPGSVHANDGDNGSEAPFRVQEHFGRVVYRDNPTWDYLGRNNNNWDYRSNDAFDEQLRTDTSINSQTFGMSALDPTKMYHMTVFYMERGLIESNCSMEFTMTPAQNDYKVEKVINTANVNSGVANALKTKDKFNFKTTGIYGGSSVSRNDAKLGNNELKDYSNQFDTGTNLNTSEGSAYVGNTGTVSKTEYSTKWIVADTDTGQIVKDVDNSNAQGTGKSTSSFNLKRQDNSNDSIHLKSTFTNTPVTAPLNVVKKIYEKNEEDQTVESKKIANFKFKMEVDLNGGTNYQAYPLDYTADGHAGKMDENGYFTFSSDETVTVPHLPKNTTFKITESKSAGYTPRNQVITGKIGETGTVTFQNDVTPSTDKIVGKKVMVKADGSKFDYTGNLFTFKLDGLEKPEGRDDIIDESDYHATINNITNGNIEFTLSYVAEDIGIHRYVFYEDPSSLAEYDANHGTHYAEDISCDQTTYFVEVKVIADGEDLKVDYIKYYKQDPLDDASSEGDYITDETGGTASSDPDEYDPFDPQYEVTTAEFVNPVNPAGVTVYKTSTKTDDNGKREGVDGIWFYLYKVSGDRAEIPSGASPFKSVKTTTQEAKVYDNNGDPVIDDETGEQKVEEQKGIAKFEKLPIYKDEACTEFTEDPYQWYCIVEGYNTGSTGGNKDYNKNSRKIYFKFPMNGKYDYAITDFVNQLLKNPQTSGNGMDIVKTVGIGIIGLAAISFGGYMYYIRTPKRRSKKYKYIKK